MMYEVGESEAYPGYFSVDAVNYEGDGEIYTTVFFGARSRERAEEYAKWQNAQSTEKSKDKYFVAAR